MKPVRFFLCACGKLNPTISGTLEVHKKFCGKLKEQRARRERARRDASRTGARMERTKVRGKSIT